MSDVLLLVHRIPFPPDKGDKIRSYHLLRYLAGKHRVHLGAFVDDPSDSRYLSELEDFCTDVFLRPVGGWRSRCAALGSMLRGRALGLGYYADAEMGAWVSRVLSTHDIRAVIAFSSTMAQYLPSGRGQTAALIADFVDIDSDKWRQYAGESTWPRTWLYRYEASALGRWEAQVLNSANAVCVVSHAESEIVPGRNAENSSKIAVIPNGVDCGFFDPDAHWPDPFAGNRQAVVFTGAMDYYANEDGVCWFVENAWPAVRVRWPRAEFFIVGSKPSAAVSALAKYAGVTVTGRVPDVRPYLHHAAVVVAPLRLARGVQNKVLEALAMNRLVVATPQALRGLEGTLPASAVTATTADEFAVKIASALDSQTAGAGTAGRDYVRDYYDWSRNLERLDRWIPSDRERCHGAVA